MDRKILVIGLDCGKPDLFFHKYVEQLPNIQRLMTESVYGILHSCTPPLTIPAWMCMTTGLQPDKLNTFGFRDRERGSDYNDFNINYSQYFSQFKKIWDYVGEHNGKSILVGIPPTFPPYEIDGCMVSGFMCPDVTSQMTYPPSLRNEILEVEPNYLVDVDFSKGNSKEVYNSIFDMTKGRFNVMKYLLTEKEWDFSMFVTIGLDRLHHVFYEDYIEDENVFLDYYKMLDKQIGYLLEIIPDDTIVILTSDHTFQERKGTFAINEWLHDIGYQSWLKDPDVADYSNEVIDFKNTTAWGWSGYYAPIFLNVIGREPHGVIPQSDYEYVRNELINKAMNITLSDGSRFPVNVYKPKDLYMNEPCNAPDLMMFHENLSWKFTERVGYKKLDVPSNFVSHEKAVHDYDGMFLIYDKHDERSNIEINARIYDITPTILSLFGIEIPNGMYGEDIFRFI